MHGEIVVTTLVILLFHRGTGTDDGIHWDGLVRNDTVAWAYILDLNHRIARVNHDVILAKWDYDSNLTDYNRERKTNLTLQDLAFTKDNWVTLMRFNVSSSKDAKLKRLFKKYSILGEAALPPDLQKEMDDLQSTMVQIYGNSTVKIGGKDMALEPDLTFLLANMTDADQMKQAWVKWRDAVGRRIRNLYIRFTDINNKVAEVNGFKDMSMLRIEPYDDPNFFAEIEKLWEELQPLYVKLHTFVRKKLKEKFPNEMPKDGTIPAHLLGNMWAQNWENLFPLIRPFNKSGPDVTSKMKAKNWTELTLFQEADRFFQAIGLLPVPDSFYNKSIIVKPLDRQIVCHASAWDFSDGKDFRIKMCTEVDEKSFVTVHHEMGHIQYYLQYKGQPVLFREGANPGFHEAIGDLMALSVRTPVHLQKLGLLDSANQDRETTINFLLKMALNRIAFLPFGYLMDRWRWDLYRGLIGKEELNRKWWEFRIKYQGVSPPVQRSEQDFDPGAKYHIPADVPYIRYFVSFIIQFQFHEALCNETGQQVLHLCDISANETDIAKKAGVKLATALKKGSSEPWQDVLKEVTGVSAMDASPLRRYFRDLETWLDQEIKGETQGWKDAKVASYFSSSTMILRTSSLVFGISVLLPVLAASWIC